MDDGYKVLHETFVSGHTGTTAHEILWVSALLPLTLCLYGMVNVWRRPSHRAHFPTSVLELVLIGCPLLLSLTLFAEVTYYFGLILIAILVMGVVTLRSTLISRPWRLFLNERFSHDRFLPYLTNYRAGMLLTTAVCILAVDFPIFPRKFAKTESFGFGLMDIGVGSFVFVGGMFSPAAQKVTGSYFSRMQGVKKSLIQSLPLIALGLFRVVLVKGSGYHEHLTEYGVHWNFFLTLAVTKVLSSILFLIVPVDWSWRAALTLSLAHESALVVSYYDWVLENPPRYDLVNANREGIVSSPGYLAIHLAGVAWGRQFARLENKVQDHIGQLKTIVVWSLIMWSSLYYSCHELFRPTSRRFANWTYFNWMVACNLTLIGLFLLADIVILYFQDSKPKINRHKFKDSNRKATPPQTKVNQITDALKWIRVPLMNEAINYNALFYFLLANLFTGSINFIFQTIRTPTCPSLLILIAYVTILHFISVFLHSATVQIKM
ncbi:hypothetical protein TCAL_05200 [Tigriopus californicus]|uniref:Phosphatidylinositol-glycan biosynthesis class W protein n=2 Tax=Tigriopus californicus TaxID=6832 RepID=A0A553NXK1_TIGCA|nr:uncharacterized protein LOC131886469 isoform X2 [Tigriopus californicus]TRY70165.1 hypothetical protein TCAL_05200 [Tigriopus californicus]|eukprot:TCALIF_05200-PA protein Name:"Similar to gwt1 GPI-anchored wall transfer protein 1 (Neurospora crassa (strain ATCC 24698 / 74-OR23-1A / CBS 708.71 / DSM 1257 / FGSC 987))" AED:0.03 eAED:0.03 QI:543/1/1/1/0.14/0.12/8/32/491